MSRFDGLVFAGMITLVSTSAASEDRKVGNIEPVLEGLSAGRACWYAGEKYSEGSPLEVGEQVLFCLPKHRHETNGELVWRSVPEDRQKQKIQVN